MRPGDPLKFSFVTQDGTGAALNADSTPTGTLRRNGSNDGTVTVTVTNNAAGDYTASGTLPATYAGGDLLELVVAATVNGIAGKAVFALGQVERVMSDEPRVWLNVPGASWYVSTTGSDANPGTQASPFGTIAHAISVAAAGDAIYLGAGTFAQGNAVLSLPDGVSLYGAGQRLTTISSTADLTVLGCIVNPGNGSQVAHLTIAAVGTGVYQGPFGFNGAATSSQAEKTNWVLDDCYLTGDSDCLFMHSTTTPTPPVVRGIVRNCVFRSLYDTVNVFANAASWDVAVDFVFCNFAANGPSIVGAGAFTARALAMGAGTARVFGGIFAASGNTGGGAVNNAINVDNGAVVEIYNALLSSSGTNAKDIAVGSGSAIVSGTQYNAGKTSGSVTVRPTSAMSTPIPASSFPVTLANAQAFNNAAQTTALPATMTGNQNFNITGQTTPLPVTISGTGNHAITVNVKDASSSANITGAVVRASGAQAAQATTDASGNAGLALNAGTITLTVTASGYSGYSAQQTIAADGTINVTLSAVSIPAPGASNETVVYIYTRDSTGALKPNTPVIFQIVNAPAGEIGSAYDTQQITVNSDGTGLASRSMPIGVQFHYRVGVKGLWSDASTQLGVLTTVPAIGPYELPDIVGSYV